MKIEITELTLMAAFRYALGRQTYIVAEVVENILLNWNKVSNKFQVIMQDEIKEAMNTQNIGDQSELEQWQEILNMPIQGNN